MGSDGGPNILHADLDAFYASVVLLKRPDLVGKPVAVGGGVVLSATYEARAMGVTGAMRIGDARQKCPRLIVVDGSFGDFVDYSDRVFDVFRDFTPLVEPISIDEAFLDVSGAGHLFGSPVRIAELIRERVRSETGLPISVGGARTKFLAKIASRVAKPDGSLIVAPGTEIGFLHALSVDHLWGVGPVTLGELRELGIGRIGELARAPTTLLASRLGTYRAHHLQALAWNRDPRGVLPGRRSSSVGAQRAFGGDRRDREFLRGVLARLSSRVGSRLRKKGRAGRTITLRARFRDLESITRSTTMRTASASSVVLYRTALDLVDGVLAEFPERGLSLLGISMSNLVPASPLQLELPIFEDDLIGGSPRELELQALDAAVDDLRDRFGRDVVGPGSDVLGHRSSFAEGLSSIMTRD
ncbi:MAG: DNA polymerase IV [Actinomycetota bacterium]|nr:DNA polymerase IV [Actinomycetota bacterium]